jgi:hypothetical protein
MRNAVGIAVFCAGLLRAGAGAVEAAEAGKVTAVPLGGSLAGQKNDTYFGVFVPTRYGGVLTVKSDAGRVEALAGPDGRSQANAEEIGSNRAGWYTFKITGADKPYTVESTFVQVGQSTRTPWNFYYWPTKSDCVHEPWQGGNGRVDTPYPYGDDVQVLPYGAYAPPGMDIIRAGPNGLLETPPAAGDTSTWFPNLYDDMTNRSADGVLHSIPSPLLKYDQIFGTPARGWEAAATQNHDIRRWPGHCLGGAIASIVLNEPTPAPGSGFTRDELKSLWAELGENPMNHRMGENVSNIPAGPPRPGPDECDYSVARFHSMLERYVRGRRQALLANLRAFPPRGTRDEVWNHGIGKYTAHYHAVPGASPLQVRIDLEAVCNTGTNLNESDPKPRINTYSYILVYNMAGDVDERAAGLCDWIAVGGEAMFAPLNIMVVLESRWQGHNPWVQEANVRAIDIANGGASSRFATSTPPAFRPVGAAGGPRIAASPYDPNPAYMGGGGMRSLSPRGGFFARVFGR